MAKKRAKKKTLDKAVVSDARLESLIHPEGPSGPIEPKQDLQPDASDMTFEGAVATLPPYCDDRDELDWIRAHPAMARKARQSALGMTETIAVIPEDILTPPHGPAPSQSSAYALQHWVNNPDKFFDQVMREQKKRLEAERVRDEADSDEDDLDFIDQMIKDVERELLQETRAFEAKLKKTKARGKT